MQEFFEVLAVEPARAFYGPGHVAAAAAAGAVSKLLITDSLYRCAPLATSSSLNRSLQVWSVCPTNECATLWTSP